MTGTWPGRSRQALITVAALVGVVAVLVFDDRVLAPTGLPVIIFSAGYVAAWVALFGVRTWIGLLLAVPVVVGFGLQAGDPPLVAVGLAAGVIIGISLGAVVRSLGTDMTKPSDPVVIALAAILSGLIFALGPVIGSAPGFSLRDQFVTLAAAGALGSLILLPIVLAFRPGPVIRHATEFVVVVLAIAVAVIPFARVSFGLASIGLVAWLTLPVLLFMGIRYGIFAASVATWLATMLATWALAGNPQLLDSAGLLQRQIVAGVLIVIEFVILLLLRGQRRALAQERANQVVTAAFLAHANSIWYVKLFGEGPSRYERLGGGPFRERELQDPVTDADLFGPDAAAEIERGDREVLLSGESTVTVETLPMPDGRTWTVLSNRFPIRDAAGSVVALGGIRTDVTEREELARTQEQQTNLLEAMFVHSPVPTLRAFVAADGGLRVAQINEALGRVIGREPEAVIGAPLQDLVLTEDWEPFSGLFEQPPGERAGKPWSPQAEVRVHTRIGGHRRALVTVAPLEVPSSDSNEFLVHVEDVTARRAAEEAVAWYSLFDAVTGLLNRTALGDRLDAALHRLGDETAGVALIALDIDDFKSVNDSHGHPAGDLILVEYGSRIRRICAAGDSVARLSADEFAVVMEWSTQESVAVFVGRLQSALAEPVIIGDEPVTCTASFGVALTRNPDVTSGEMVRQAELALFRAKRMGRARVEFYAESMRAQAQAVLNVRNELAQAVAQDGFLVAYQPIVLLLDGSVVGFEALVRLPTTDGRILAPGDFLDVARSADMVTQIDRLVLRRSLADLAGNRLAVPGAGLSVNAEPDDLRDPDFAMGVLSQLHAFSVAPEMLTVEVTEAALLQYDEAVLANIGSLREAGVSFAIDDFGTGYSSLAQLRRLDADIIKIDRSFVTGMEHDPEDANIVATVISLAHRLGLVAVAEGVETREQAETLQRLGCDRGQGYLFGHPLPIAPPTPPATAPGLHIPTPAVSPDTGESD